MTRALLAMAVLLALTAGRAFAEPILADQRVDAPDPVTAAQLVLASRLHGMHTDILSVQRSLRGTHVRLRLLSPEGTPVADGDLAVHFFGDAPHFRARIIDAGDVALIMIGRRILDVPTAEGRARSILPAARSHERVATEAVALPAGNAVVRPGYRVFIATHEPEHLWEIWVDAETGAAAIHRDRVFAASGMVYKPNPMCLSGDPTLMDDDGADSPALTALREPAELMGLDGSGTTTGAFANTHRMVRAVTNGVFDYTRSQPGFIEVNAYYHVDHAQRFIQSLGFTGASAILQRPFEIIVDALSTDQSMFVAEPASSGKFGFIEMGTGGVDDAEDGDIVAHEYGHAVEDAIVPGYGLTQVAGSLGEGWGDFQAHAIPIDSTHAVVVGRECIGAWDATAYVPPAMCLRRVDGTKHYPERLDPEGDVHVDGEIWSGALYDMYHAAGLTPVQGYQIVLESMFLYNAAETFQQAAQALYVADQELNGGVNIPSITRTMIWHGVDSTITPASRATDVVMTVPETFMTGTLGADVDQSMTFTQPGAAAVRLHFASIDMQATTSCAGTFCDAIYLYDKDGNAYARLGGQKTDLLGPAIPGDTVTVRWITNDSGVSAGFTVDRLEILGAPPPIDAGSDPGAGGGCGCQVGGGRAHGTGFLLAGLACAGFAFRRRRG